MKVLWRLCVLYLILMTCFTSHAAPSANVPIKPRIIIILDDLGYRQSDLAAFRLPSEVTFSILPQTPLAQTISRKAEQQGRAVMLHMPMQSTSGKAMGPLGLSTDMYPAAITHTLRAALKSVPNAVGVNNHMGSAFTVEEQAMQTIMEEIKRQGLFFVDSRTSVYTTAQKVAERLGVPNTSRQVFLDNDRSTRSLYKQFEYTKKLAKRNGTVVVIAHPYPETLTFLTQILPTLANEGITLTSVDEYFSESSSESFSELSSELDKDIDVLSSKDVDKNALSEAIAAAPNE
ncbi:divergent polysaccharide deacetylase family protein [Alteromonas sp. 1_MG-2023]|uniref:divergent polysaccharide deacetylase family protein n=1 Tax=Alteromonas sp. 1_MG-2023 TaxID=3062669 RepID=UPI0026E314B0|nr:divergent polysaccharide deacetylase family protein [Alteromonas sp. 1_MG-2023]MDO6567872.1 divergent polysaccharide deacetylase family protein [Alteromonas sp. 1_MG-2023]